MESTEVPIGTDIIDALSNFHLSFLVPKQELIHLFTPGHSIHIDQSPVLDDPEKEKENERIRSKLCSEDNNSKEEYEQVINDLLTDFDDVDLSSLDDLKFRKPAMQYNKQGQYDKVPLGKIETAILNKINDVKKTDIIKPPLKMKRIKLAYGRQKIFEAKLKTRKEDIKSLKKRELEQEQIALAGNMAALHKKARKSSYLQTNELHDRLAKELVSLVDRIGLVDDQIDTTDYEIWWDQKIEDHSHSMIFEEVLTEDTLLKISDFIVGLQKTEYLLDRISIDYLLRIQNLCCNSLTKFAGSNFAIESENDDFHGFRELCSNAYKAASIIMELLLSGRDDKQLYLERYLLAVVEFTATILENVIVPLSTGRAHMKSQWKNYIRFLAKDTQHLLSQINSYILSMQLDEGLITRLEYLCILILFTEFNSKERDLIVPLTVATDLKMACCDLLCSIFHTCDDQTHFIIEELLINMDKLPINKTIARNYKLSRGINVQLISVLLIRLIQSFSAIEEEEDKDDTFMQLMNLDYSTLKHSEKNMVKSHLDKFITRTSELSKRVETMANQITSDLLNKFMNTPSAESNMRHVFEILLEDLLNMVSFPEWAGVETLLSSLMKTAMFVVESDSYPAQSQTLALEVVGSIGVKILHLKSSNELIYLTSNMSVLDFATISKNYTTCLQYLKSISTPTDTAFSFNFFTLKAMANINELAFQTRPQVADVSPLKIYKACSNFQRSLMYAVFNNQVERRRTTTTMLEEDAENSSIDCYNKIMLSQELLHLYDPYIKLILKSLEHTKIKSRTKAIRNLSALVSKEPAILSLDSVSSTIAARLNDSSAQVKDAVIELIAQFIDTRPEVITDYYQIICQKMNDPSIAVRKRVLKLSRNVYTLSNDTKIRATVAEKLLVRLFEDEEDSIVEMAQKVLMDVWFLSLDAEAATGPALPANAIKDLAMSRIEIILEVVGKSEKNLEYLRSFISENITTNAKSMNALKIIIDKTLEFVIENTDNPNAKDKIAKAMGFLSAIVKHNGMLINQDQLICLKPYLTDESSTGDNICYYTLKIFKNALPQMQAVLAPSFVRDCQVSLLKRLTKFNSRELSEAMPCAWMLSRLRDDTSRMATAAISCLKLVKPYIEQQQQDKITTTTTTTRRFDPKLLRLLFLIGNFGKYCDFQEKDRLLFIKSGLGGLNGNEQVVNIFIKFLLCFTSSSDDTVLDPQIKRAAIRNIVYICSSHPRIFLTDSVLTIMDKEFKSNELDIKAAIIQEFIEFLQYEEASNIEKTRKGKTSDSKNMSSLDVSVFHGNSVTYISDGIATSLVQRYMDQVLEMALLPNNSHHSALSVRYLQLVVRLGYANPKLCIPVIIALESSPSKALRTRAVQMHQELFEKYETLIESGYNEGIRLAFNYRRKKSSLVNLNEKFFLRNLFSVLGDSKSSRKRVILSIIKLFAIGGGNKTKKRIKDHSYLQKHKEFLAFIVNNLSAVMLSTLEEAYLLCHGIDKLLASEGVSLSSTISNHHDSGIRQSHSNDDDEEEEEEEEQDEDDEELLCMASQCQALMILARYREYLFQVYGLSEERADEFQPNKVEKDLRVAPKQIREVELKLKDLIIPSDEEDYAVILSEFQEMMNESLDV